MPQNLIKVMDFCVSAHRGMYEIRLDAKHQYNKAGRFVVQRMTLVSWWNAILENEKN